MLLGIILVILLLNLLFVKMVKRAKSIWTLKSYVNVNTLKPFLLAWPKYCYGKCQSPININSEKVYEIPMQKFELQNFDSKQKATISNNGHTVSIVFQNTKDITLSGGGLFGVYHIYNIHFHWKAEHQINGKRFPVEIHLVFMHTDCKSIQDAINSQWVTVLGILVEEISKSENKSMEAVTNQISEIENADKNKAVQLKQDILVKDFLPKNITSFYRYFGSLTTPAYNEGVLWTVFKEPLRLSKQYIENIKCIRGPDGNILENTFRPIQPLNDRIIYATSRTN